MGYYDAYNSFDPNMDTAYQQIEENPYLVQENDTRGAVPFYMAHQIPDIYTLQRDHDADMNRMKDLYPEMGKRIQNHIEDTCDRMEYDGSLMFDEYPDKNMLNKISSDIYDNVKDYYDYDLDEDTGRDEMLALNRRPPRHYGRDNWMRDLIDVMLYNEMYRRRCRRRNCRRWY